MEPYNQMKIGGNFINITAQDRHRQVRHSSPRARHALHLLSGASDELKKYTWAHTCSNNKISTNSQELSHAQKKTPQSPFREHEEHMLCWWSYNCTIIWLNADTQAVCVHTTAKLPPSIPRKVDFFQILCKIKFMGAISYVLLKVKQQKRAEESHTKDLLSNVGPAHPQRVTADLQSFRADLLQPGKK